MATIQEIQTEIDEININLNNAVLLTSKLEEKKAAEKEAQAEDEKLIKATADIEALKDYQSYYADKIVEPINNQLGDFKINLFEVANKADGTMKESFMFTYNGIAYKSLCGGETVMAEIKIVDIVQKKTNNDFPMLVDKLQDLTNKVDFDGQMFFPLPKTSFKEITIMDSDEYKAYIKSLIKK